MSSAESAKRVGGFHSQHIPRVLSARRHGSPEVSGNALEMFATVSAHRFCTPSALRPPASASILRRPHGPRLGVCASHDAFHAVTPLTLCWRFFGRCCGRLAAGLCRGRGRRRRRGRRRSILWTRCASARVAARSDGDPPLRVGPCAQNVGGGSEIIDHAVQHLGIDLPAGQSPGVDVALKEKVTINQGARTGQYVNESWRRIAAMWYCPLAARGFVGGRPLLPAGWLRLRSRITCP